VLSKTCWTPTPALIPVYESLPRQQEQLSTTVRKLVDIYKSLDRHSLREDYLDTPAIRSGQLFNLGYLNRTTGPWPR
jgi:arginine decarboxylase